MEGYYILRCGMCLREITCVCVYLTDGIGSTQLSHKDADGPGCKWSEVPWNTNDRYSCVLLWQGKNSDLIHTLQPVWRLPKAKISKRISAYCGRRSWARGMTLLSFIDPRLFGHQPASHHNPLSMVRWGLNVGRCPAICRDMLKMLVATWVVTQKRQKQEVSKRLLEPQRWTSL